MTVEKSIMVMDLGVKIWLNFGVSKTVHRGRSKRTHYGRPPPRGTIHRFLPDPRQVEGRIRQRNGRRGPDRKCRTAGYADLSAASFADRRSQSPFDG